MRIYVVEDDFPIQKLIEYALKSKGYETKLFEESKEFFKEIEGEIPDLIILDIMLPGMNGIEILRNLKNRLKTEEIPVIMLTAKTSELDIVTALDIGADDYIKKPFSVLELLSRVNALLRRFKKEGKDNILEQGPIKIDSLRRKVEIDSKEIVLTFKEFELLKYMLINKEIVLTREKLLNSIWGYEYEGESRTVDMHIKLLREKLGKYRYLIETVRGVGYKFHLGEENE